MTRTNVSDKQIIDILKELPTKKDLVILQSELKSEITQELDKRFSDQEKRLDNKLNQGFSDQEIRLTKMINTKIDDLRTYIETNVGRLVEDAINPILDNHDERLIQLEKKTGVPTISMKRPLITN